VRIGQGLKSTRSLTFSLSATRSISRSN
jgi:hypothetical protein